MYRAHNNSVFTIRGGVENFLGPEIGLLKRPLTSIGNLNWWVEILKKAENFL